MPLLRRVTRLNGLAQATSAVISLERRSAGTVGCEGEIIVSLDAVPPSIEPARTLTEEGIGTLGPGAAAGQQRLDVTVRIGDRSRLRFASSASSGCDAPIGFPQRRNISTVLSSSGVGDLVASRRHDLQAARLRYSARHACAFGGDAVNRDGRCPESGQAYSQLSME